MLEQVSYLILCLRGQGWERALGIAHLLGAMDGMKAAPHLSSLQGNPACLLLNKMLVDGPYPKPRT